VSGLHTDTQCLASAALQGDEGDEILGLVDTDERLDQKNCYLWSCREGGMASAAEKVRSVPTHAVCASCRSSVTAQHCG
jgi:hypothetical protein